MKGSMEDNAVNIDNIDFHNRIGCVMEASMDDESVTSSVRGDKISIQDFLKSHTRVLSYILTVILWLAALVTILREIYTEDIWKMKDPSHSEILGNPNINMSHNLTKQF